MLFGSNTEACGFLIRGKKQTDIVTLLSLSVYKALQITSVYLIRDNEDCSGRWRQVLPSKKGGKSETVAKEWVL